MVRCPITFVVRQYSMAGAYRGENTHFIARSKREEEEKTGPNIPV
jgi:hypothetical protein